MQDADKVYRVVNTDKIINLDRLKFALGNCTILASVNGEYEPTPDGSLDEFYTNIYYILTTSSRDDSDIICKYEKISRCEHDDSTAYLCKAGMNRGYSIDTLYEADALYEADQVLLAALDKGIDDMEAGRTLPLDEAMKKVKELISAKH